MPERSVVKFEREITKVQVVYDASWEQPDKPSLNDLLCAGPYLLPKLYEIILFFLCGKIVLVAVIKQSLLQMEVNHSRRGFLQSLWCQFVTPDNPSKLAFRFTRISFGLNSIPVILKGSLEIHMILLTRTLMDDTTITFKGLDSNIMSYNKVKMYLSKRRYELRKWETNDNTVRDFLHQNETS